MPANFVLIVSDCVSRSDLLLYGEADARPVLKDAARLGIGHFKAGRGAQFIVVHGLDI